MPLVNTKCPIAVKHNITDMAILPESAKLYVLLNTFVATREATNTVINTINGFIDHFKFMDTIDSCLLTKNEDSSNVAALKAGNILLENPYFSVGKPSRFLSNS